LELESPSEGKIKIHRTDVQGSKAGLTATYNGTLRQDRLGGEFESHYQGRDESGNWYAIIGVASPSLPTVMHFCGQGCATLTLENGRYISSAGASVWEIESLTQASVILNRSDTTGFRAVYKGQVSVTVQGVDDGDNRSGAEVRRRWHATAEVR
jgi:hypothetical protein